MNTIDCIKSRRSVRKFTEEKVPHEVLEQLVELARWAPSWKNTQIARYVAVEDEALKNRIAEEATIPWNEGIIKGAPVLMVRKRVRADEHPVIASVDYLSSALFHGQDLDRLDFSRPIFDVLEDMGIQAVTAVAHVKAVYGDAPTRAMLELNASQAVLLLDEVSHSRLCQPVLRSLSYYTDFFDFSILRKKL